MLQDTQALQETKGEALICVQYNTTLVCNVHLVMQLHSVLVCVVLFVPLANENSGTPVGKMCEFKVFHMCLCLHGTALLLLDEFLQNFIL